MAPSPDTRRRTPGGPHRRPSPPTPTHPPSDIVMTLDRRRGAGPGVQGTPRLDDVRVEGPLNEEAHLAGRARLLEDLTGSLLEDPDELTADDLALLLRVGDAGESVHEAV